MADAGKESHTWIFTFFPILQITHNVSNGDFLCDHVTVSLCDVEAWIIPF